VGDLEPVELVGVSLLGHPHLALLAADCRQWIEETILKRVA
jgi:hypothetical protein